MKCSKFPSVAPLSTAKHITRLMDSALNSPSITFQATIQLACMVSNIHFIIFTIAFLTLFLHTITPCSLSHASSTCTSTTTSLQTSDTQGMSITYIHSAPFIANEFGRNTRLSIHRYMLKHDFKIT